jgi:hypothetical protein
MSVMEQEPVRSQRSFTDEFRRDAVALVIDEGRKVITHLRRRHPESVAEYQRAVNPLMRTASTRGRRSAGGVAVVGTGRVLNQRHGSTGE